MDEKIAKLKNLLDKSDNIVFFGGAGVSTESGIPDFRSKDGIFTAINEYGYRPEIILSHTFFCSKPEIFFEYYKKYLLHTDAIPNTAHLALSRLEKQGKLKAVITQNIDNLHQKVGSQNVLPLHGTLYRHFCTNCKKEFSIDQIIKNLEITKCDECGKVVRPDIVLYEENLNQKILSAAIKYISNADLLIVGGTSLSVYPAAGLIDYYSGNKLILINKSTTGLDKRANLIINDSIGAVFSELKI